MAERIFPIYSFSIFAHFKGDGKSHLVAGGWEKSIRKHFLGIVVAFPGGLSKSNLEPLGYLDTGRSLIGVHTFLCQCN